jgi:hypothetical protein
MLMAVHIILDIYRLMFIPRRNCRPVRRGSLSNLSRMDRWMQVYHMTVERRKLGMPIILMEKLTWWY